MALSPSTARPGGPARNTAPTCRILPATIRTRRSRPVPDPIHLVPLFEIDAEALARDRTSHDEPALLELRLSIATSGLRMPVEVFPLAEPYPPFRYGLISGFRRLAAFRALHDLTGHDKYATIPAFLRAPETLAHAITAMVEENAIRVEISPWERAAIAMRSARAGLYPGIDAAVDAIYLNLTRARRARIRAIAHLADELDGHLDAPETLSERQLLRLAPLVPRGFGDLLRATLAEAEGPEAQWRAILPILLEAERPADTDPARGGSPRRHLDVARPSLTIRRELTRRGWSLHFSGRDATSEVIDLVFGEIERMFAPVPPRDPSPHKNLRR